MMRQIFSFTVVIFLHINMILAQTSGANFLQHQDQLLIQDRQDETLVSAQVVDCNAASTGLTSINDLEKNRLRTPGRRHGLVDCIPEVRMRCQLHTNWQECLFRNRSCP